MLPLDAQFSAVLASRVQRGGRYALVDYPDYNNPGDAAIWLGTRKLLEQLAGGPPAYVSSLRRFDPAACVGKVGDGTVFLLGGGNFGSLYARHHTWRLAAIAALHGNRVVQLPFSLAGVDGAVIDATRRVVQAHPDLTLIARDSATLAKAEALLGVGLLLAPDPAHALAHALASTAPCATKSEARLFRKDRETTGRFGETGQHSDSFDTDSFDWADIGRLRVLNRLGKLALMLALPSARLAVMDLTAQAKVTAAVNSLAPAKRVMTDRLHGMILAQMIGRDVVVHDNATGKVAAYLRTWGASLGGVTIAATVNAA